MIIIRCFRNAEILTPFSHCTKTDKMCKKERKEKPRNTLYSIVRFYMLYVQKKRCVVALTTTTDAVKKRERKYYYVYSYSVTTYITEEILLQLLRYQKNITIAD